VKGWCRQAKCEIKVDINAAPQETVVVVQPKSDEPLSYLAGLKQKREKVLKEVVSAREDGDLKENSAYHAAREQLSIIDDKILKEEDKIRRANSVK
jgi:transcription elongation factor GreA